MEFTQGDMVELAGVVLTVLLGGVVSAILIARTSASRRDARHRKISNARRARNTSYDLLTPRDKPADDAHAASRRRRKRRRHSPNHMIDLLRHEESGAPAEKSPAGGSEPDPGSA